MSKTLSEYCVHMWMCVLCVQEKYVKYDTVFVCEEQSLRRKTSLFE